MLVFYRHIAHKGQVTIIFKKIAFCNSQDGWIWMYTQISHFRKTGVCIRQECFKGKNGKEIKHTNWWWLELMKKYQAKKGTVKIAPKLV